MGLFEENEKRKIETRKKLKDLVEGKDQSKGIGRPKYKDLDNEIGGEKLPYKSSNEIMEDMVNEKLQDGIKEMIANEVKIAMMNNLEKLQTEIKSCNKLEEDIIRQMIREEILNLGKEIEIDLIKGSEFLSEKIKNILCKNRTGGGFIFNSLKHSEAFGIKVEETPGVKDSLIDDEESLKTDFDFFKDSLPSPEIKPDLDLFKKYKEGIGLAKEFFQKVLFDGNEFSCKNCLITDLDDLSCCDMFGDSQMLITCDENICPAVRFTRLFNL